MLLAAVGHAMGCRGWKLECARISNVESNLGALWGVFVCCVESRVHSRVYSDPCREARGSRPASLGPDVRPETQYPSAALALLVCSALARGP